MEGGGEGLAELAIADRLRCRAVEDAVALAVLDEKQHGAHQVLHVDPAHHLRPRAHGAAETEAVGGQHPGQGAPFHAEHQADAQDADPGLGRTGLQGQLLPLLTEAVGELVVGGLALLVQRGVVLAPIPADGGGIEQQFGGRAGELDEIDQLLGQQPAAVAQQLLAGVVPAPGGDGFTRQVDDDVHVVEMIQPVQTVEQGDVVAEQLIGCAALAGQYHHLVRHLEVRHQAATDETRASRDQYLHVLPP